MKILFIGPNQRHRYNPGHQLFRDEIARQHDVTFYGPKHPGYTEPIEVQELVEEHKAECVMTYNCKYTVPFAPGLYRAKVPKVHFVEDYFGVYLRDYDRMLRLGGFDILFTRSMRVKCLLEELEYSDNVIYCPYSVDDGVFKPNGRSQRTLDVLAAMSIVNKVYPIRPEVLEAVRAEVPSNSITKRVFDQKYVETLQRTKIGVNSISIYEAMNWKVLEIPCAGALLLTDKFELMDGLGFRHGENCLIWNNIDHLKTLLRGALNDSSFRERITAAGMALVYERHTNKVRVANWVTPALERVL